MPRDSKAPGARPASLTQGLAIGRPEPPGFKFGCVPAVQCSLSTKGAWVCQLAVSRKSHPAQLGEAVGSHYTFMHPEAPSSVLFSQLAIRAEYQVTVPPPPKAERSRERRTAPVERSLLSNSRESGRGLPMLMACKTNASAPGDRACGRQMPRDALQIPPLSAAPRRTGDPR